MPNLRTERRRLALTQRQVADLCQVDRSAVSYWENGRRYPRLRQQQRLTGIFGLPVTELLPNDHGAAPKDGPTLNNSNPAKS